MKILICGVNGQLGQELLRILKSKEAEIGPIPEAYKDAIVVGSDVEEMDITDTESVQRFIMDKNFDLIINCAAMTNVDGCEENEDVAFRVNAEGAQNLAEATEKIGAKFVHISTDYVFSGERTSDWIETDIPHPQTAYGRTKLAGERFVEKACSKYFIIRTAWLYGYVGPNFPKTIMKLSREKGVIKVVDDQIGNPTSANDLAFEILKIAATDAYGVYHCTNKGACSWFDFACEIVDTLQIPCEKIPCTTAEFPRLAKRPAYSSLQNKRLEDTIGDDMRPWKEALSEYLKNISKRGGRVI